MAGPHPTEGDRYEFRIFRPKLGAEAQLLEEMTDPGRVETRVDRYLVVPGRPDAGLKIRGGRHVELKLLRDRWRMLERWHPAGGVELPATGRYLAPLFCPLGLPSPRLDASVADGTALVGWGFACSALDASVAVRKHRRSRAVGGTRAEMGDIRWNGRRLETLAIEGADREEVAALVARLGLAGAPNTSYPCLLGLSRPDGEAVGASG